MDIHELWIRGKSTSEIARLTGRDRKTVRRALRECGPAGPHARQVTSKLDPFRNYIGGQDA